MEIIINILIAVGTFLFMEFTAWFTHKFVMHGLFWSLHKDHHVAGEHKIFFERNDWFFVIFALPSIILFTLGSLHDFDYRFWIGTGIFIYGAAYFFVHDLFIHQRIKTLTQTNNTYLLAIRRAHKMHHKYLTKEQGQCFGMLIVPYKYWIEAKKHKRQVS